MKSLIVFLCGLMLSVQALADQRAVLLGPDLEPVAVQLRAWSPQAIRLIDAQGESLVLKPDQVLRLSLADRELSLPDPARAVATLRDGQVLVGKLVASNDEEAVRLELDTDRAVQVPLDELLSLVVQAGSAAPAVQDDDALRLATGEVLLGFVETIDQDAVGFVVGDADDAIRIPLDRVKALSIANKPKPAEPEPGAVRITTTDGSVLLMQQATLTRGSDGDELVGTTTLPILPGQRDDDGVSTAASSQLALPIKQVVTIEPASTRHQLTPLTDHAWQRLGGGEVFGVAMPPRVTTDGDLRLHAPITVGFDLPDGASRLAFMVAMDLDDTIPETRRPMAGCELVVYEGDRVLAKHTLTPHGPAKRINLPLTGSDVRLVLEPGVNGPVLDRVILTQAELLVKD